MNTRKVGQYYEDKAVEYLGQQDYQIIERNYRCRYGEIDIIARDQEYLVFVEVKYRRSNSSGNAVSAVDFRKQKKISGVAAWYMMKNKLSEDTKCRFDVVSIEPEELKVIKDAFDYIN